LDLHLLLSAFVLTIVTMAGKRRSKRGGRKQTVDRAPMPVVDFDAYQAESQKTRRDDSVCVRGQFSSVFTVGASSVQRLVLDPTALPSTLLNNMAAGYTRFRIKRLHIKLDIAGSLPPAGTQPFLCAGVEDDDVITQPTSLAAIVGLRCSVSLTSTESSPEDVLVYTPVDKNKWYYTADSADTRFSHQATLYMSSFARDQSTLFQFAFTIAFAGRAGANGNDIYASHHPYTIPKPITAALPVSGEEEKDVLSPSVIVPRPTALASQPRKWL
jgi:hypothetical protein